MGRSMIFSVIPLVILALSIAGIVVLTLGVRGRPIFSSPRCAKCSYDLRNVQFLSQDVGNCPECGAALSALGGVSFGRWQRRPRQIVWGFVLLALPWILAIPTAYVMRRMYVTPVPAGPMSVANQPTSALLASLPANLNAPWHWQELEKRMKAGTLTTADVDAAIAVLVKNLNAARAAGKDRQSLHWCDTFITAAVSGKKASQAQLDALCRAYYGDAPKLKVRDRAREGEPFLVEMVHESWDLPNLQRCYWLSGIVADGSTKLTPKLRHNEAITLPEAFSSAGGGQLDLLVAGALPPGEHELTLTYEMGVVPKQATLRGIDGKPGTPDKWPTPVSRWQGSVKRKITIKPKDAQILRLVTDDAANPLQAAPLTMEQALIRPASRGVELAVHWKTAGTPSLPVSYRVRAQLGDQSVECGTILTGRAGSMSFSSHNELRARLNSLPPDVKHVHFSLEPNPRDAERHTEIQAVWAQPMEIRDVPLERFDLAAPATAPASRENRSGAEQLIEQPRP
ncbi:MAG: hypothetical protein WBD40_22715 [Tepidisphaeraceae bacterium]